MYKIKLLLIALLFFVSTSYAESSFFELSAQSIKGEEVSFETYRGKVVLVANTALFCGTTPQFADLQTLYEKYKDRGLVVMGFPSNDFTKIEPNKPEEIEHTCENRFGVTFPLFSQKAVTGDEISPVFSFLTQSKHKAMSGDVGFNFEKFLIGRDGTLRKRYGSFTGAMSKVVQDDIEKLLAE